MATVQIGAALQRGDSSLNGKPAVVVMVNKQPLADTPTVTRAIEAAMQEVRSGLPEDIKVDVTFSQNKYIDASIDNVRAALIEGSIIVSLILIPFLMNWRNLLVYLVALPLSLLLGVLVLDWLGQGLNRSGRAPGDSDAAAVNTAHLDVDLSEAGLKDRKGSIEKLRAEFAKLHGVAPNIGGFISHRMDEVLSGVRSGIAVKIFGSDLQQLHALGQQVEQIMQYAQRLVVSR